MERTKITRDVLASAFRYLRSSGALTQKSVAERAVQFQELGFGKLLESQVSDFERGRTLPSLGSLVNFLAACSEDGEQVDFRKFQKALEAVGEDGGLPDRSRLAEPTPRETEIVVRIAEELSERWAGQIQGAMRLQKDELAELRTRIARTERLVTSLLAPESLEVDPE